jgi:hypothetical protein
MRKRDANCDAVLLARVDQVVGGDGQIVHEGVAQETEHCLAGRKIAVVPELKAVRAIADGVEDEYRFNIQLIVGRTVTGTKVVRAEENDLSGLFEQVGHGQSPKGSRRE